MIDTQVRRCVACGCTDDDCSGCIERTGEPCHWVAANLCSACLPPVPSLAPRDAATARRENHLAAVR